MIENVLVLGATSGIAQAVAAKMAARGCNLILAGRNRSELERIAADLRIRHQVDVAVQDFDAMNFESHSPCFRACSELWSGGLHGILLCYGYLPDQQRSHTDFTEARHTIDINFTSAVSLLNLAATYLERRGKNGYLAAISSVAADRGRQSNYLYGATKAGLAVYLDGLRNRLYFAGVHVLNIKPGFVDTAMTKGLFNPQSRLVVSPQHVAHDIDRAIQRRRNTLYTPWFWRFIMLIIRQIPEMLFKRMRL